MIWSKLTLSLNSLLKSVVSSVFFPGAGQSFNGRIWLYRREVINDGLSMRVVLFFFGTAFSAVFAQMSPVCKFRRNGRWFIHTFVRPVRAGHSNRNPGEPNGFLIADQQGAESNDQIMPSNIPTWPARILTLEPKTTKLTRSQQ